MKPIFWECAVLSSGAIALAYPQYATSRGLPVGSWWRRRDGFPQLAALAALACPAVNMVLRGEGWTTLWLYPLALAGSFAVAYVGVELLRQWSQLVALFGITVGVVLMWIFARGPA